MVGSVRGPETLWLAGAVGLAAPAGAYIIAAPRDPAAFMNRPPDNDRPAGGARPADDDSWNRYWEHGFLTSCRNAFAGNYEGELRAVWDRFFAELPAGTRVLDICTGNGAIAMIANDYARAHGTGFEIHGIDSAAIRPAETVQADRARLEGIVFHPSTPAEDTGLPGQHFGAITGQYAYEYTDESKTAPELARIARPGAPLQFVIHHTGSIVMETSREELANCEILFAETEIFERARAMIELVGAVAPADRAALAQNPEAERRREALNRAAARVSEAAAASPHPQLLQMALDRVGGAYKALAEGLDAALARLAEGRGMIESNRERLLDLMAAGRSRADFARMAAALADAGFDVAPPAEIHNDGGALMGWVLRAHRREG
jgi:ubiquinone/menaquinone biosynthesis C-methylase UbiE